MGFKYHVQGCKIKTNINKKADKIYPLILGAIRFSFGLAKRKKPLQSCAATFFIKAGS
jgi:hypothetical protein